METAVDVDLDAVDATDTLDAMDSMDTVVAMDAVVHFDVAQCRSVDAIDYFDWSYFD